MGQTRAARRHVGERSSLCATAGRQGSEWRLLAGDMDQSGGTVLRVVVARLGRAVVGTYRCRGAPQCTSDGRHPHRGIACFLLPELPRDGTIPLRRQPLSLTEQDVPARGHPLSNVSAGVGDVGALVSRTSQVRSPRTTTRDRLPSTMTCSSCSRSAPSTARLAMTSTFKTMSTSTKGHFQYSSTR